MIRTLALIAVLILCTGGQFVRAEEVLGLSFDFAQLAARYPAIEGGRAAVYEVPVDLNSHFSSAMLEAFISVEDCVAERVGSIATKRNRGASDRDEVLARYELLPLIDVSQFNDAPLQQRRRFLIIRILKVAVGDRMPPVKIFEVMHRVRRRYYSATETSSPRRRLLQLAGALAAAARPPLAGALACIGDTRRAPLIWPHPLGNAAIQAIFALFPFGCPPPLILTFLVLIDAMLPLVPNAAGIRGRHGDGWNRVYERRSRLRHRQSQWADARDNGKRGLRRLPAISRSADVPSLGTISWPAARRTT